MNKKKKIRTIEDTLNSLYLSKRSVPKIFYGILLLLYLIATTTVGISAGAETEVTMFGHSFPIYTFAGVFSALANICVIFLAVYFDKTGFVTSLVLLLVQLHMVLIGVIVRHNITSLPGVFGTVLAIIAVIVIYVSQKRMSNYQNELRKQAVTDMLTGLPNWFACTELIDELIKKREAFAVVSIDFNGFKAINDTMGFETGNEVLVEIASKWKIICNQEQTGTTDFIARLSGDEFALLIRNYDSDEEILNTIKQYDSALNDQVNSFGYDFYISASFGYALIPEDSDDVETAVSYADVAMREVKKANSSVHIMRFNPEMLKNDNTIEMEGKIRSALDNDNVFFMLQPQYDMSHKLRGFEALARMKDDDGSVISPMDFIPVAEKVGLIDKLDMDVFKKSASFVSDLIDRTGADIILSLNVSVRHLMKKEFTDEIKELIHESNIPEIQLELEITESIMIESMEKAMECIRELKNMGIHIAIDDFGTGYSSLSYLNSFPADLLKIDKAFIDKMNSSESSKQYVAAIISLGHIMGFDVISEGVEEPEQIETLREIGCDYIQGFVWGRPLSKEDAEKLVLDLYK